MEADMYWISQSMTRADCGMVIVNQWLQSCGFVPTASNHVHNHVMDKLSKSKLTDSTPHNGKRKRSHTEREGVAEAVDDDGEWTEHVSSSSGRTYYYNKKLDKSQWEPPEAMNKKWDWLMDGGKRERGVGVDIVRVCGVILWWSLTSCYVIIECGPHLFRIMLYCEGLLGTVGV